MSDLEGLHSVVANSCDLNGFTAQLIINLFSTLLNLQCSLKPKYPKDIGSDHLSSYDFIVVGAGSAGSSLAAKLSEQKWSVLLIEAGEDPPIDSDVPLFYFSLEGRSSDWAYKTVPQSNGSYGFINKQSFWPRGKFLGGCSSINAMIYQEGNKKDYDTWSKWGNKGWSHDEVKKYFDKYINLFASETGLPEIKEFIQFEEDIKFGAANLGYSWISDRVEKSRGKIGYFDTLLTIKNGTRNNAARVFLEPIKDKNNLHILKNSYVSKIEFNNKKEAKSVEVYIGKENRNQPVKISARKEIILSAGSINTPKILQLSGIGSKIDLEPLGIKMIEDLPVGKNLLDHPLVILFYTMDLDVNIKMETELITYLTNRTGTLSKIGHLTNLMAFINTEKNHDQYATIGYHYFVIPKNEPVILKNYLKVTSFNPKYTSQILKANKKSAIFIVFDTLLQPQSKGEVKIKSKNPFEAPFIDPNYLDVPKDIETLVEGIKHTESLFKTEPLKKYNLELIKFDFDNCLSEMRNQVNENDTYYYCYTKYMSSTLYHPVGTAKMSPNADGVVDERLKVKNVSKLRVADGSIMPYIVSANTNIPIVMIGEKTADMIVEDWSKNKKTEL